MASEDEGDATPAQPATPKKASVGKKEPKVPKTPKTPKEPKSPKTPKTAKSSGKRVANGDANGATSAKKVKKEEGSPTGRNVSALSNFNSKPPLAETHLFVTHWYSSRSDFRPRKSPLPWRSSRLRTA